MRLNFSNDIKLEEIKESFKVISKEIYDIQNMEDNNKRGL